jgi:hypothetical protein
MPLVHADLLRKFEEQDPVPTVELDLNRERQRVVNALQGHNRQMKMYFSHASTTCLNNVAHLGALIVHFSGHGKRQHGLQVEHERGLAGLGYFMPAEVIARLFSFAPPGSSQPTRLPKLFFLSACFSGTYDFCDSQVTIIF